MDNYIEFKEHLKCIALSRGKTKEVQNQLFSLYEKQNDYLYRLQTENSLSDEDRTEIFDKITEIIEKIREIEDNTVLCNSKEVAENILNNIEYELENTDTKNQLTGIIDEFGLESQEAMMAQDLIELEKSIKPAKLLYTQAEKEMNDLIMQIQAAREQGSFIINLDNEKVKNITHELSQEEIAEIINNNSLLQEDNGLKDLVTKSFNLSDVISKDDPIYNQIKNMETAKQIAASEKSQHPIAYSLGVLASIPSELKKARDIAKNAGLDYQNAVEKAIKNVSVKTASFFENAKHATMEKVEVLVEDAASLYKTTCSDFYDIVETSKSKIHSAISCIVKYSDIILDTVTMGLWSNYCEKIESIGQDKILRDKGLLGKNTKENKILSMMKKDPNGLISKLECESFYNIKNTKTGNVCSKLESVNENICYNLLKVRLWALSGNSNFKEKSYWNEVDKTIWGNFKNPADTLKDIGKTINQALYYTDNYIGNKTNDFKADMIKKCDIAKSTIHDCKDKCISVIKDIPTKTKELVENIAEKISLCYADIKVNSLKLESKIVDKAISSFEKTERRTNAHIKSLENFDKVVQEKIQDIQKEINDLSSITPYVRKPYKMTESIQKNIALLKEATPTAEIRFALKSMENREKSNELRHNAKENTIGTLSDLKNKMINFFKKDVSKTQLDTYIVEEKAVNSLLKQSDHKLKTLNQAKDFLQNKQKEIVSKIEKTTNMEHSDSFEERE